LESYLIVLVFRLPGQKGILKTWPGSAAEDLQYSAQSLGPPDPVVLEHFSKYQDFFNIARKNLKSFLLPYPATNQPLNQLDAKERPTALSTAYHLSLPGTSFQGSQPAPAVRTLQPI
jgi:hypothetical protein